MRRLLPLIALIAALTARTRGAGAQAAVDVSMRLDRSAYTTGATLTFTITVSNPADDPVTLTFSSGQMFDITVTRLGSQVPAWRWSDGRSFVQSFVSRTIPPRDTLTFTATWNQRNRADLPVPSGVYAATAQLTVSPRPNSAPLLFVLGESQFLGGPGCVSLPVAFPDGTPAGLVASAIDPPDALEGMWRLNGDRWLGWSPLAGAPTDLQVINFRDLIRLCLAAPARWITPF